MTTTEGQIAAYHYANQDRFKHIGGVQRDILQAHFIEGWNAAKLEQELRDENLMNHALGGPSSAESGLHTMEGRAEELPPTNPPKRKAKTPVEPAPEAPKEDG